MALKDRVSKLLGYPATATDLVEFLKTRRPC